MTHLCRFCGAGLQHIFADLGMSPVSNAFLREEQLDQMEAFYPLTARVCAKCFLVQLPLIETPEKLFGDYAYFSSYSETWLAHAREYCDAMMRRFAIGAQHLVVEIASNDGYLLQYFAGAGVPVVGVEPAANVAAAAQRKGIETVVRFFGAATARELVKQGRSADLLVGNNVLPHVPDLHDFVSGLSILLAPHGVLTMEFPHLRRLMSGGQFDTIYHEHYSYFSLRTAQQLFGAHGLAIFDVEELPTHGGSLRVYAAHAVRKLPPAPSVEQILHLERQDGLTDLAAYARFSDTVRRTKRSLLQFLIASREERKRVVAYGAPAKGNTLLNYCGVRTDFVEFTVDRSPHKQGRFLPGTHIPVYAPERITETRPDYVLILPWNLRDEIVAQMAHVRSWGGKFVVPIPEVEILS